MQALADSLQPALRLPAVQQLFPALRRLSLPERQQLRDVVAQLANADARIDVFECCLTLLLAANLDDLEAGPLHGSASLLQEVAAIHTLFAILAAQGTGDDARARRAYEAGISVVLPEHQPPFRADRAVAQGARRFAGAPGQPAAIRQEGAHRGAGPLHRARPETLGGRRRAAAHRLLGAALPAAADPLDRAGAG